MVDLVRGFADKLSSFTENNLKDTPVGLVILKDADFKLITGIEEIKQTHFIPVYHGLLYVGVFNPATASYVALST